MEANNIHCIHFILISCEILFFIKRENFNTINLGIITALCHPRSVEKKLK